MPVQVAVKAFMSAAQLAARLIRAVVKAMVRVLRRMAGILARGVVRLLKASARLSVRFARASIRTSKRVARAVAHTSARIVRRVDVSRRLAKRSAEIAKRGYKGFHYGTVVFDPTQESGIDQKSWMAEEHEASSRPGDPPGERTGELIAGIINEGNRIVSLAPYSADLELGTVRVAPRPFMFRGIDLGRVQSLDELRDAMKVEDFA